MDVQRLAQLGEADGIVGGERHVAIDHQREIGAEVTAQKRSGLLGLSSRSGDMQELRQLAMAGNADANLARSSAVPPMPPY